jgi:tripeptidyl-peptidase I
LKLGLQGVTIVVSSADYGIAGQSNQCIDPLTGELNNGSTGHHNPTFPATCPYVTAVGGTQLPSGASSSDAETAFYQSLTHGISSSGGGFSNVFPCAKYQLDAVQEYVSQHHTKFNNTSMKFNATGRAFPDVALNAANYVTVIDGGYTSVFGTSASTPVFGSIITKINDARLSAGKRPVGFINPVLYSNPYVMNDITTGHNYGCGVQGFDASSGWDPVTGLGTPNYDRLLKLYLQLP